MDYKERFKKIVFEKGFYDEDYKMTIFTPKEDIEDPYYDMKYLTLIVDEEDNLQAGIDRNGFLFIETLSERQIELEAQYFLNFFTKDMRLSNARMPYAMTAIKRKAANASTIQAKSLTPPKFHMVIKNGNNQGITTDPQIYTIAAVITLLITCCFSFAAPSLSFFALRYQFR